MQQQIGKYDNRIVTFIILFSFYTYERLQEMVAFIQKKVQNKPDVAIICGSGLGGLAELVVNKTVIPYVDIPHFPRSTGLMKKFLLYMKHFFL